MLILILIDIQYLKNAVFSLEEGLNGQNHSVDSHHLIEKSPPAKIPTPQGGGGGGGGGGGLFPPPSS